MTDFTVTLTDPRHLYALKRLADGKEITADEYVQFVIENAAESWAKDYPIPDVKDYDDTLAQLRILKAQGPDPDVDTAFDSLKVVADKVRKDIGLPPV